MLRDVLTITSLLIVLVQNNQAKFTTSRFTNLALRVSKAAYQDFRTRQFIRNGFIMNAKNKRACNVGGWTATGFIRDDTEVLLLKHSRQKLAVFGFRGTEGFNLNDWLKNFKVVQTPAKLFRNMFKLHSGFNDRFEDISKWFRISTREYLMITKSYSLAIVLVVQWLQLPGHLRVEY